MRACSRVALVLVALSASVGLAGCTAIDDLKFGCPMVRVREAPRQTQSGSERVARRNSYDPAGENSETRRNQAVREDAQDNA